ncbi:MAG: glycoside hydrolase family 57 [Alphaproteobacteria bacterium]|nr:glycoside hydrolase family 57 [Alphaproteobacteria bacterium]
MGADGSTLDIIWTDTIAFQKLQRLAHGDIDENHYRDYVLSRIADRPHSLAIYSNDAECFDFRTGRFKTEERLTGGEWERIARVLRELKRDPRIRLGVPSIALELHQGATPEVHLQSPENPILVKKQRKYNVTRWAVTGRNDLEVNTLCWRIFADLDRRGVPLEAKDWRTLCDLWASDYRTHITPKRWAAYRERLAATVARIDRVPAPRKTNGHKSARKTILAPYERWIDVTTATLDVRLNCRRGLAIDRFAVLPDRTPLAGTILHGELDDIALAADWYTGNCVFEAPGQQKITDLEWCEPVCEIDDKSGAAIISTRIETPRGPILKSLVVSAQEPRINVHVRFEWEAWGLGVLRLGHLTLKPGTFDEEKLVIRTHNGGRDVEEFPLKDRTIDHGHPVSFLVSASNALGMTEGWCEVTDGRRWMRVEVDKTTAALIGMLTHRKARNGTFCQLMLSALEMDETRKPGDDSGAAREFAYAIMGGVRL